MTIAAPYIASASLVLNGTKYDEVSSATLATTGTVTESSDEAGPFIEVTGGTSYLTTPILPRLDYSSGYTYVLRIKTTRTGIATVCGALETGTSTLENLFLNTSTAAGDVLNGCVGIAQRDTGGVGDTTVWRTPAIGFNDGDVHTVVIERAPNSATVRIFVDGAEQTVTKSSIGAGNPQVASGSMGFPNFVFSRNNRGTSDQPSAGKIYFLARLRATGYDLASLSSNPYQIVESGGAPADGTASGAFPVVTLTTPGATATGTSSGATNGASSGALPVVSTATPSATATGTTAGSGTVSIPPITDFGTRTVLKNVPNITADFYNISTKALVVSVTGLTSHASTGAVSVVSTSLVAGTTYRTVVEFTYSGHTYRGVWNLVAS